MKRLYRGLRILDVREGKRLYYWYEVYAVLGWKVLYVNNGERNFVIGKNEKELEKKMDDRLIKKLYR